MRWIGRSVWVEVARCYYCGAGLRTGMARFIVVGGRSVGVHRRHPRRAGEVAA
ncbi:hypothetical protein GCM10010193_12260 [Kitasatospora atroaurantiaca]|uniref:Uncharacterized protein n=1 Tax=Kitasatospora atroaurantiaca TaxID=285545 RepID=A0A561EQM7_9ACTN|nr:hypothetical protein FB465_2960 [Kitasatospora atroaurantiaca]